MGLQGDTLTRPETVLEALAAWEVAAICENPGPRSARHPRFVTRTRATGQSPEKATDNVDRAPLLETIMANNPTLRTRGITLLLDDYILMDRLIRFIGMVDNVPNQERVKELVGRMKCLNGALSETLSTTEPITTGILRASLYSVINEVCSDPHFWKEEHRDTIGRMLYGDPVNTVASVGDVTGWYMPSLPPGGLLEYRCARNEVTVQHKRECSLPDSVLEGMDAHFAKYTGLKISLAEGGGLVWSGMKGKEHAHLRRQICQILTQIYANKNPDGILFNTRHLRVFTLTKDVSTFHVSSACLRTAPRQNVDPGTGKVNRALVPTPVLAFISVLATATQSPTVRFPITKFKRAQPPTSPDADGQDRAGTKWIPAGDDETPDLKEEALDLELIHISELPEYD